MPRRKVKPRLPTSVYLAFFSVAATMVRAAGFETLPGGGILTAPEMDRMDEWCERGEKAEDFGAWVVEKRQAERIRELALADENLGNETIALSEVAA